MKKIIFTTLVAIAAVSAAIFATLTSEKEVSKLTLDNVLGLTDGEVEETECHAHCTKAIAWGDCYRTDNGWWCCTITLQVMDYVQSSCVEICHHDRVSRCPSGTTLK